jgi:DNA-binding transcriptional ArsR family regulator
MITVNALSEVAALMGDPARASMLQLLMDGRAHTASDLAHAAGVTAQTASGHLSRMVEANLLAARARAATASIVSPPARSRTPSNR